MSSFQIKFLDNRRERQMARLWMEGIWPCLRMRAQSAKDIIAISFDSSKWSVISFICQIDHDGFSLRILKEINCTTPDID